jgi:tripartite-type tricarboxylate transporter receptor subunit TctC
MNTSMRLALLVLLSGFAIGSIPVAAYPDKPIRLVVPSAPGGIFDAIARIWGDKAKAQLETIIIDNHGGAGGALGAAMVAKATPDGYTILLGGLITNVTNAVAGSRRQYDPMSFEPISILGSNSYAFAVHPSMPVSTLQELLSYSRKHPGTVSYGTAGVGSLNHLTGELFKFVTKSPDITHVPYRGAGPALVDLLSGRIRFAVVSFTTQMMELHRSGKMRLLAVTSPQRLGFAPEIPTTAEAGLGAINSQQFVGLFAPPATPRAFIDVIARATQAVAGDKDYQNRLATSGFEIFPDASPDKMRQINQQLFDTWSPIIKSIGLKLD